MDMRALQARARKARDEIVKEKHQLFADAWKARAGEAQDRAIQRIQAAREQLHKNTLSAADQGKDEVTLLRLSYQPVDLRHMLQEELHRRQEAFPRLRSLGPPSFRILEQWLSQDLGLKEWDRQCPLDWLVALRDWIPKKGLGRLLSRPRLPEPLSTLWKEAQERKLQPRWEFYRHREDDGIALVVRWKR